MSENEVLPFFRVEDARKPDGVFGVGGYFITRNGRCKLVLSCEGSHYVMLLFPDNILSDDKVYCVNPYYITEDEARRIASMLPEGFSVYSFESADGRTFGLFG